MCMNSTVTLYLILCVIDTKINTLLYRKSSRLLIAVSVTYDTWLTYHCLYRHLMTTYLFLCLPLNHIGISKGTLLYEHMSTQIEYVSEDDSFLFIENDPFFKDIIPVTGKRREYFICADNILYNCDTLLRIIQKSTYK